MFRISFLNRKLFLKALRIELEKELPGKMFHSKMSPSLRKSKNIIHVKPPYDSSILILLYPSGSKLNTVLIKRTNCKGIHSGQIGFPGGKFEKNDADLINTALRETKEEIGISPEKITVLGKLTPLYIPVSNMNVLPVIGSTDTTPLFKINKKEVQYLIETSLGELSNPSCKFLKTIHIDNKNVTVPFYNINNEHIWGATAMILSEFLEIIRKVHLSIH